MVDLAQNSFIPFGSTQAGVSPQGFDFGQFAQQIAGQVVPLLPNLILSVLSSNPLIGAQVRAQSASPHGFAPQSLFNFGVNTPFGSAGLGLFGATPGVGVSPQGFDFGQFAQQILQQVTPILPSLIASVLSAHPTLGPQLRAQSALPAGFAPQSLDFGQIAGQIAQHVLPALPGLLLGLLSAHPVLGPQLRAQGVAPQSLFNFGINTPLGGAGVSLFGATPGLGVTPQGFDFGQFAQQIAGQVAPLLPQLILSVLSANPAVGAQLRAHTTH